MASLGLLSEQRVGIDMKKAAPRPIQESEGMEKSSYQSKAAMQVVYPCVNINP